MEILSTKQVGQRIRRGTLPEYSDGGFVSCACHNSPTGGQTESLRFWSKGDKVGCSINGNMADALAVFPAIGVTIDTRR